MPRWKTRNKPNVKILLINSVLYKVSNVIFGKYGAVCEKFQLQECESYGIIYHMKERDALRKPIPAAAVIKRIMKNERN